jgi:hypothetical protein
VTEPKRTCPSASAGPGATLLGIFGPGGKLVYVPHGPKVTDTLVDQLGADTAGPLESHFRFSTPCAQSACAFWNDGCHAIAAAHEDFDALAVADALPECGIRDSCRWYHQEGPAACRVCPYVRTTAEVH